MRSRTDEYRQLVRALDTARALAGSWADLVRQDVERALGIGPDDDRSLDVTEYGVALDVYGLVDDALLAAKRAGEQE